MSGQVIVIGVGNLYRRDDALGPTVVRLLRERNLAGVSCVESDGEPVQLLDLWHDAELAVVIDAVRARPGHAGHIHRLAGHPPAAAPPASSHAVDLGDAIELARSLDRLPPRLLIYAVEVAATGFGIGLSPEVAASANRLADEIAGLLATTPAAAHPDAERR